MKIRKMVGGFLILKIKIVIGIYVIGEIGVNIVMSGRINFFKILK